jgi:flagellar hook-associated protein 3 FlgL
MRVTFNSFPDTLLGRLQSLGKEQNKSLTQLSTGQRLAAPSDDAPAMQRILNLRTEKKQNQQFHRNAIDGLEKSKVTFSSLEQIKDLVVRASELSANINGATSEPEYKAKASEINQLIEQGLNVANTKLRGNYLLSGDSNSTIPFVETRLPDGKIASVSYNGSSSESKIHIGEGESASITVGSMADENRAVADTLSKLIELRNAMSAAPSATKTQSILDLRAKVPVKLPATTALGTTINLPAEIAVGDQVTFDFTAGKGTPLQSGQRYYVVDLGSGNKGVSMTPEGPSISLTQEIDTASTVSKVRLDTVEDTILSALSRAGTIQYRLETAMKDLEVRYEGTEKLISTDADIDFAEATVRLNRAQMAYQAAIQSGARIQNNSLLDYLR